MEVKNQNLCKELIDCLENMIKHYRTLLEVVRKEKEILVSAKLDELNENNKTKDALLVRIRSLENSRMKLARDLAQAVGADFDAPRLLDIANHFSGAEAERLRNLHNVLDLLVRRVSEVNRNNEILVQSALNSITGAMHAIRDTLQDKPTYAKQGVLASTPGDAGHLVRKEA